MKAVHGFTFSWKEKAKLVLKSNNKGFTLIELMVVIAIIALLATIGVGVYSGVQSRARDAKRIEEIRAVASSIQATKDSATGKFTWASTNASSDFPAGSSASPYTSPYGDGNGNKYCVIVSTVAGTTGTSLANPPLNSTPWGATCPTSPAYTDINTAAGGSGVLGVGTAFAFKVCAALENTNNGNYYFCQTSN